MYTMTQHKPCLLVLLWVWMVLEVMGCGLCEESKQNSYTCPNTEEEQFHVSVEVFPYSKINIQCLKFLEPDYSLLEGCEFPAVLDVVFDSCTLPNISFKDVLKKIGVNPANVSSLTLFNVSQEGNLTLHHLEGLDGLVFLQVTGDIYSVTSNALRATSKLEILEISNTSLTTFAADIFENLTSLQTLMVEHNELEEIPSGLFVDAIDLDTINLDNNAITTLHQASFKGLQTLRTLSLSNNKLEMLSSDLFSENPMLEFIDLSANLLSEIKTETFTNLQNLKVLNLAYNKLKALPTDAFLHCRSLNKIELNNNFLTHPGLFNVFPKDSSLTYIDLSHNNLKLNNIRNFALNNQNKVEHLLLSHNNISVIPDSLNNVYINLKTVDLSWNSFNYLDFNSLIFQSNNVQLNFKHNNIQTISFEFGFSLLKKKKLDLALEGNPLSCDCLNYGFFRVLQGKSFPRINYTMEVTSKDIDESFCLFPSGDRESLMQVKTEVLTCSLDSSDNCSYAYRLHDKMVIIDCSYLHLKSIQSLNFTKYSPHNFTLILANNTLKSLNGLQHYINLLNLSMPFNKLPSLNISHLPPNLKALDVRGNNLTTLSSVTLDHLNNSEISLKLGGNPWHCNCEMLNLSRFLHVPFRKVNDYEDLKCKEDGQKIMSLSEHDLCPFFMQPLVIVVIVVVLIILILFAICGTVSFYKYELRIKVWLYAHHMCLWAITEDELDADKTYDAFISYSHKDEDFVMKVLVPGLECGEPKYRVCLHWRDWVPGEFIQNQIVQSVEASRRTIVVLSSSFIESVWGQLEFLAAHSQALQDRTNRIIIIVYGKIPPEDDLDEKLKLYISTKTYVKWGDKKFWEKLRYIMPHPPDLIQKKQKCNNMRKLEPHSLVPKQSVC